MLIGVLSSQTFFGKQSYQKRDRYSEHKKNASIINIIIMSSVSCNAFHVSDDSSTIPLTELLVAPKPITTSSPRHAEDDMPRTTTRLPLARVQDIIWDVLALVDDSDFESINDQ